MDHCFTIHGYRSIFNIPNSHSPLPSAIYNLHPVPSWVPANVIQFVSRTSSTQGAHRTQYQSLLLSHSGQFTTSSPYCWFPWALMTIDVMSNLFITYSFSLKYSKKTHYISSMRERYGVSFVNSNFNWYFVHRLGIIEFKLIFFYKGKIWRVLFVSSNSILYHKFVMLCHVISCHGMPYTMSCYSKPCYQDMGKVTSCKILSVILVLIHVLPIF